MEYPNKYKNADGFGVKVTVDIPDTVYLKSFGTIALALAVGITIGAIAGRFINPKKQ